MFLAERRRAAPGSPERHYWEARRAFRTEVHTAALGAAWAEPLPPSIDASLSGRPGPVDGLPSPLPDPGGVRGALECMTRSSAAAGLGAAGLEPRLLALVEIARIERLRIGPVGGLLRRDKEGHSSLWLAACARWQVDHATMHALLSLPDAHRHDTGLRGSAHSTAAGLAATPGVLAHARSTTRASRMAAASTAEGGTWGAELEVEHAGGRVHVSIRGAADARRWNLRIQRGEGLPPDVFVSLACLADGERAQWRYLPLLPSRTASTVRLAVSPGGHPRFAAWGLRVEGRG